MWLIRNVPLLTVGGGPRCVLQHVNVCQVYRNLPDEVCVVYWRQWVLDRRNRTPRLTISLLSKLNVWPNHLGNNTMTFVPFVPFVPLHPIVQFSFNNGLWLHFSSYIKDSYNRLLPAYTLSPQTVQFTVSPQSVQLIKLINYLFNKAFTITRWHDSMRGL